MTKTNGHIAEMELRTPVPTPPSSTEKRVAWKPYVVGTEHELLLVLQTAALHPPTAQVVSRHTCHVGSHFAAVTQPAPASASGLQSVSVAQATVWAPCPPSVGAGLASPPSAIAASCPCAGGPPSSLVDTAWMSEWSMPSEHPADIASTRATTLQARPPRT